MKENEWIHDQRLSAISEDKKQFLNNLFFEINRLSQEEKLPFIMALMSSGKLNSLSFENNELSLMMQVLKDYTDQEQLRKMQSMLQFLGRPQ